MHHDLEKPFNFSVLQFALIKQDIYTCQSALIMKTGDTKCHKVEFNTNSQLNLELRAEFMASI